MALALVVVKGMDLESVTDQGGIFFLQVVQHGKGIIAAAVVDHDDFQKFLGVVLIQRTFYRLADPLLLVKAGDDDRDARLILLVYGIAFVKGGEKEARNQKNRGHQSIDK